MEELIKKVIKDPIKTVKTLNKKSFTDLLDYLSDSYYEKGISLVGDEIFDVIYEFYEDKYKKVNLGNKTKEKVKLPYYLGSQDKIKSSEKEINNWIKKYPGPYIVSNKLDGLSALIVKENDKLNIYTRGTKGIYGHDKTHHLEFINVNTDKMKNGDAVRGELIISKDNFKKHLSSIRNTSRNSAVGFINSKSSDKKYLKLVDFVAFSVINPPMTQEEQFKYIKKLKMKHTKYIVKKEINVSNLSEFLVDNKTNYEYEMDGLVISDTSQVYSLIEGENPKYSFSFKSYLTEEKVETTVINIEWNISKSGKIVPILIVNEVEIDNVKINRCTGNNAKYIVNNNINIGSKVLIIRSNDVIPKIEKVIKPSSKPGLPKDIKYKWDKTNTNIISIERNEEQENQYIIKNIESTINTLGIEFLGEGNITKFVDNGYNDFLKILKAEKKKTKLYDIEGFSDKIIDKIYISINKVLENIELPVLMASSNYFEGLGVKKIKMITNIYPNIIELYNKEKNNIYDDIINIHGYEKISTDKFVSGLPKFIKWFEKLKTIKPNLKLKSTEKKKTNKKSNNDFNGKKIAFSGVRDKEMEKQLEELGATISTSVSKNTNILIVKDKTENSSKINKAKELNIEIINIDDAKDKLI